jgi:bisphosphoglycerate-dependent phosphoglycerate mutase
MALNPNELDTAFSRFSPRPTARTTEVASAATRQTAALSPDNERVCPYCHRDMTPAVCRGHKVWLCSDDRHVAPFANADLNTQEA